MAVAPATAVSGAHRRRPRRPGALGHPGDRPAPEPCQRSARRMKRQRGAALLLVLWALALLSVLLGGLAGWVQLQSRQALWLRQHTQTVLAAEAGIALVMADRRWIADGRDIELTFDDAQLHVSLRSERGKL